MLNDISRTPTFERDWKRLKRKHYDPAKLRKALQTLMAEDADTLQREYRDHALKGEWLGFRELHIEGDWLLIREAESFSVKNLIHALHGFGDGITADA